MENRAQWPTAYEDLLTPNGDSWEYCILRTDIHEKRPVVLYFRADCSAEMEIRRNPEKGDWDDTAAYRRVIAMLGDAGWEMMSDAYTALTLLEHGRRDLIFKRRKQQGSLIRSE